MKPYKYLSILMLTCLLIPGSSKAVLGPVVAAVTGVGPKTIECAPLYLQPAFPAGVAAVRDAKNDGRLRSYDQCISVLTATGSGAVAAIASFFGPVAPAVYAAIGIGSSLASYCLCTEGYKH